jgi:hypothetical protein
MADEFTKRCPECFSDDLDKVGLVYVETICLNCGLRWKTSQLLDLRLLPPQPAPPLPMQEIVQFYGRGL